MRHRARPRRFRQLRPDQAARHPTADQRGDHPTILPACTLPVRSLSHSLRSAETFPSVAAPRTTTPEPSLPRQLIHKIAHLALVQRASTRCDRTFTPFTSTAAEAASETCRRSRLHRTCSSSRRSFLHLLFLGRDSPARRLCRSHPLSGPTSCPTTRGHIVGHAANYSFWGRPHDSAQRLYTLRENTALETDPSPATFSTPISPVAPVWVSSSTWSVEKYPIAFTTRTPSRVLPLCAEQCHRLPAR